MEEKPITRYWLLIVLVTVIRLLVYAEPTREYVEAAKRELWSLENL